MTVRILIGDVREQLAALPDESVHCVVTSPPYYGLRDYGTAQWEGGDASCSHEPPDDSVHKSFNANSNLTGLSGQSAAARTRWFMPDGACRCGARRVDRQLGLESSPEEYVDTMVSVFRDVRRALRKDGTLWLNIGDSYATQGGRGEASMVERGKPSPRAKTVAAARGSAPGVKMPPLCKPKDLIGIPWMLAFALRADGWYLRSDIIWSKPNPMPESVTDRPTKAHEYLFLLAKSERYYYDADAIKDASITEDPRRPYTSEGAWELDGRPPEQRHGGKPRTAGNKTHKYVEAYEASDTEEHRTKAGLMAVADVPWLSRNKRSVWTVATAPYSDAHFATFPPALIEPCILAGCPVGGTVLDPFFGAGTTGLVSDRLRRNSIGIELNPAYAEMARRRIEGDAGLFAEVAAE